MRFPLISKRRQIFSRKSFMDEPEYINEELNLEIHYGPAGSCPVQAEGTICGEDFYFRSRHDKWQVRIGDTSLFAKDAWVMIEDFPHASEEFPFAASYATREESIEFIEKCARIYINGGKEK